MQQLLVMMQKISAEPDNNARANSHVQPDVQADVQPVAPSSEINVGSYRPSEVPELPSSDAHGRRKYGVAPPEKPSTPSKEHLPVDRIDKQSETSADESQSAARSFEPTDAHADAETTSSGPLPVVKSESRSDDEGVGQEQHEQGFGELIDDSADILVLDGAKGLSGRLSSGPDSHEVKGESDTHTVNGESDTHTVQGASDSYSENPILRHSEDQLVSSTTVGSVPALVVQTQQPELDESSIVTVSASSFSIQDVDAEPDEPDVGASGHPSGKPPASNAGFIKRWFRKAVSWFKRLVGF